MLKPCARKFAFRYGFREVCDGLALITFDVETSTKFQNENVKSQNQSISISGRFMGTKYLRRTYNLAFDRVERRHTGPGRFTANVFNWLSESSLSARKLVIIRFEKLLVGPWVVGHLGPVFSARIRRRLPRPTTKDLRRVFPECTFYTIFLGGGVREKINAR